MKADPASTVDSLYGFAHQCEATVRRANRDQTDALGLTVQPAACTRLQRWLGKCGG